MTIVLRIREKRVQQGLSQTELALRLGVTQGAVMKWETGRCFPSLPMVARIAEILRCPIDDLILKE